MLLLLLLRSFLFTCKSFSFCSITTEALPRLRVSVYALPPKQTQDRALRAQKARSTQSTSSPAGKVSSSVSCSCAASMYILKRAAAFSRSAAALTATSKDSLKVPFHPSKRIISRDCDSLWAWRNAALNLSTAYICVRLGWFGLRLGLAELLLQYCLAFCLSVILHRPPVQGRGPWRARRGCRRSLWWWSRPFGAWPFGSSGS